MGLLGPDDSDRGPEAPLTSLHPEGREHQGAARTLNPVGHSAAPGWTHVCGSRTIGHSGISQPEAFGVPPGPGEASPVTLGVCWVMPLLRSAVGRADRTNEVPAPPFGGMAGPRMKRVAMTQSAR